MDPTNITTSWDGTCSTMESIDLLSPCGGGGGGGGDETDTDVQLATAQNQEHQMEQISEERTNQCDENNNTMSAAATTTAAVATSAGAPSLLTSSSDQQNAIYQINFDVDHLGKNKPQSKRMAVWKYGIPQDSADGNTTIIAGHEARLIWSTHSGRYTISVDGEEVFASVAKGSVLEHKWKWSHKRSCVVTDDEGDADCVAMRIIACRKPPIRSSKDFRCYEFVIGGKVFRDLPVNATDEFSGREFQNEESVYEDGKLMSILDIIEPGWRADGFA